LYFQNFFKLNVFRAGSDDETDNKKNSVSSRISLWETKSTTSTPRSARPPPKRLYRKAGVQSQQATTSSNITTPTATTSQTPSSQTIAQKKEKL